MSQETHTTGVLVNFGTTFAFFFLEALFHYNIGKTGRITLKHFHSPHDLLRIASVVMLFSFLATVAAEAISHLIGT